MSNIIFDTNSDPNKIKPLADKGSKGEIQGIYFLKKCFYTFNSYPENRDFEIIEHLNCSDKERTHDGYLKFYFHNAGTDQNIPVWCQVKYRSRFEAISLTKANIADLKARNIDTNCFLWFLVVPYENKVIKVHYKVSGLKEYNDLIESDKPKIKLRKEIFFENEYNSIKNFFLEWRKQYYELRRVDQELEGIKKELSQYDNSTDKIKPVAKSLIMTRKEASESDIKIDLNDHIKKIGKSHWVDNLISALEKNPTLQSRFYEILNSQPDHTLTRAVNSVILVLLDKCKYQPSKDWKNPLTGCILMLNKYLTKNKTNEKINLFYSDTFKSLNLKVKKDVENYGLILFGITRMDYISMELWNLILSSLEKLDLQNFYNAYGLVSLSTKQFLKYPDQSALILVEVLKKSHNYNSSNSKYCIEDFLKKLSKKEKTQNRNNLIEVSKAGLIASSKEIESVIIDQDLTYKTNSIPFSYSYIYPCQKIRGLKNFSYFDLLWELFEKLQKKKAIGYFDNWLELNNLPESIVFFIYRFCKKEKIKYSKIDNLIEKLKQNKHIKERPFVNIDNWLADENPEEYTGARPVTDQELIEWWQNENLDHRKTYLKWDLRDWEKDIEFETNNLKHSIFCKVIENFVTQNKQMSIQDLIEFFGKYSYQNQGLKHSYQLACIGALEEQDLAKEEIVGIFLENIQNGNIPLKGEIAKHIFWFVEKQFDSIKNNPELVKKSKDQTIKFLQNYQLEPEYQDSDYQSDKIKNPRATIGTIINTPKGIAFRLLILKFWHYYIKKQKESKEIKEFVGDQFDKNKPFDRDAILYILGNASKEVLDGSWKDLVEEFLSKTLAKEYNYSSFFFVVYLLNRWLQKAQNHQKGLSRWIKKFFEEYQSDGRDDYQEACIYEIYAIEIWLGIFEKELKSVFEGSNPDLKKALSQSIIETAENYRKYFKKEETQQHQNRVQLEKRLGKYLYLAVEFLSKNTSKDKDNFGKPASRFLRPIIYDYKDSKKIEDYFSYWLGENRKEIFKKILGLNIYTFSHASSYGPQFLKMDFLKKSKKLRNYVIDFFLEYLESRDISEACMVASHASKIIFIVNKDGLQLDQRVKTISNKLIEASTSPQALELAEIID